MKEKQNLILEYLKHNDGQGYYIDIRDAVSTHFDDEDDFDTILHQLVIQNVVHENNNDTLYKLS